LGLALIRNGVRGGAFRVPANQYSTLQHHSVCDAVNHYGGTSAIAFTTDGIPQQAILYWYVIKSLNYTNVNQ